MPQDVPPDLLTTFASAASEGARAALLRRESQLHNPEAVAALCDQANHWAREDPNLAQTAAEAALWLAKALAHPPSQGLAHRTLANIFTALARYPEAFAEYTAALDIFNRLDDDLQAAITRSSAFPVVVDTLGADSALDWAASARAAFRELGDQLRLARLENNLAVLHYRREDYERALRHWKAADATLQEIGEQSDQAATLRNLAVCSISLNCPEEATSYYKRARQLCVDNNFTYLIHTIDYNIAYLHYLQGDHHRALKLYQVARTRSRELQDTYHEALCSLDETEIYIELNLLQEALTVAQLAVAQFKQLRKPYEQAKALFFLSLVLFQKGEPRSALSHLDVASQAFAGQGNIFWPGQVELLRASIFLSEGRFFEATRAGHQALKLFSTSGLQRRAAHSKLLIARVHQAQGVQGDAEVLCRDALATLEPFGEPDSLFQAYFLLGLILQSQEDSAAALAALRRAERYLLELRERRVATQIRVSVFDQPLDVYAEIVGLLLGDTQKAALSAELFRLVETAKARSFADLMALSGFRSRSKTTMRSQLVDQVSTLRQELTWLYRRIDRSELPDGAAKPSVVASLQLQSQQKEKELARTLSSLRVQESGTQADPERIGISDIDSVREVLQDATLIEFYAAHDLLVALVLSAEDAIVQPIAVLSTIHDLQRRLWHHLHHASHTERGKRSESASLEILESLYSELILPLEPILGHSSSLIIVPHGPLFLVPFHALSRQGEHLIQRSPIAYSPSAAALVAAVQGGPGESTGFGVLGDGQPEFEGPGMFPRHLGRVLGATKLSDQGFSALSGKTLNLPWTATHLVGSATLRSDNPLFSSVSVGKERLTFLDLHRTRRFGPLVTIEGRGFTPETPRQDQEVQALWGALLASGAESVLVPVGFGSPGTHREHGRLFYSSLSRGEMAASAFRQSALALIAEGLPLHEWVTCYLVGNPFLSLPGSL